MKHKTTSKIVTSLFAILILSTAICSKAYAGVAGYTPQLGISITFSQSRYPIGAATTATVSLSGPGNAAKTITVSGPGTIDPTNFSLAVGSSRTVNITLPTTSGDAILRAVTFDAFQNLAKNAFRLIVGGFLTL